jgi:hypothetical protein
MPSATGVRYLPRRTCARVFALLVALASTSLTAAALPASPPAVAIMTEPSLDPAASLDLKDGRFGAPECSTVGAMIEGLQLAYQDDEALLEHGITLFDSLYRSFEQSSRATGPKIAARPRRPGTSASRARRGKKGR